MLRLNPFIISLISSFISEELIIILSIVSGKSAFFPLSIFLGAIIGAFLADIMYFYIGRHKVITWLKNHRLFKKSTENLPKFIKSIGKRNLFLELFITKFIYGTRIPAVISISHNNISKKRFFLIDLLAIISWALIVVSFGWLSGRGITLFLDLFKGIERFLFITILTFLIYFIFIKLLLIPYLKKRKYNINQSK
jgi:membrane protein DedA with SNARE-associated domain